MSIKKFVEMTIFLCLICFSIYDKMQGFIDESCLFNFFFFFIYLFFFFFLCVCVFKAEIKDGRQKWQENDFSEKSPVDSADTLWVKNFVEIALSHSVSKINMFLRFMQKFKMATKSGGKTIFEESCQKTLQIPCGSKISSKSLYLAPFLR